jgi:tRNA-splicing endonuclease subunit Sen34
MYMIGNSKVLVFDPNCICELQEKERVCGHLVGSLANNSRQNQYYGSPLLLTIEEAKLLIEQANEINLYQDTDQLFARTPDTKIAYDNYLETFFTDQNKKYKDKRLIELAPLKSKIIEGKRKSLQNKIKNLDSQSQSTETINKLNEELKALDENDTILEKEIKNISKADMLTEIFLLTPSFFKTTGYKPKLKNEQFFTVTSHLNYKYVIFKALWSKGWYLTPGAKFGGDYLVYDGHPSTYHSKYILLCMTETELRNVKLRQIIHFGRMSTGVKKTFLLACVDENSSTKTDEIIFICIDWSHV